MLKAPILFSIVRRSFREENYEALFIDSRTFCQFLFKFCLGGRPLLKFCDKQPNNLGHIVQVVISPYFNAKTDLLNIRRKIIFTYCARTLFTRLCGEGFS
jgi:hypothetical protein